MMRMEMLPDIPENNINVFDDFYVQDIQIGALNLKEKEESKRANLSFCLIEKITGNWLILQSIFDLNEGDFEAQKNSPIYIDNYPEQLRTTFTEVVNKARMINNNYITDFYFEKDSDGYYFDSVRLVEENDVDSKYDIKRIHITDEQYIQLGIFLFNVKGCSKIPLYIFTDEEYKKKVERLEIEDIMYDGATELIQEKANQLVSFDHAMYAHFTVKFKDNKSSRGFNILIDQGVGEEQKLIRNFMDQRTYASMYGKDPAITVDNIFSIQTPKPVIGILMVRRNRAKLSKHQSKYELYVMDHESSKKFKWFMWDQLLYTRPQN